MSDTFGVQTLTFVAITDGPKDRLGIPSQVRTSIDVTNCRFRPLSVEEKVALTDEAIEIWKGTVPPDPAVLAAKAIDEVKHNGITYQLFGGVKPHPEADSPGIHHVTVLCKLENVQEGTALKALVEKVLRHYGFVHVNSLPMRDFAVSYHSPHHWVRDDDGNWTTGEPRETSLITIEGTLRGGRHVVGDLKETEPERIT